jgi:hypothetical protein
VQTLATPKEFEGLEMWLNVVIRVGTGVLYGYLGYLALRYAVGAGGSSSGAQSTTAKVMSVTLGRWLVGVAGLVIIGFGIGMVVRGVTGQFLEILDREGRHGESDRRRAGRVRRAHPRPAEVRGSRPGAARRAPAAVRSPPPDRDRGRHRLLRSVLLRPGSPPVEVTG